MKKFLIIISFMLLMIFGIISCGKNEENNKLMDTTNNEEQQIDNNNENLDQDNQEEDTEEESKVEEKEIEYINIAPEEVKFNPYVSFYKRWWPNNLLVPPSMFEEQMWLEANEFTAMNLDEVLETMETGKYLKDL